MDQTLPGVMQTILRTTSVLFHWGWAGELLLHYTCSFSLRLTSWLVLALHQQMDQTLPGVMQTLAFSHYISTISSRLSWWIAFALHLFFFIAFDLVTCPCTPSADGSDITGSDADYFTHYISTISLRLSWWIAFALHLFFFIAFDLVTCPCTPSADGSDITGSDADYFTHYISTISLRLSWWIAYFWIHCGMNPTVGSGVCVWTFSKEVKLVRCHQHTHYCFFFLEFSFGVIILFFFWFFCMYWWLLRNYLAWNHLALNWSWWCESCWFGILNYVLHEHFSIPVFRFGFTLHSRGTLPIVMLSVQRRGHHYGLRQPLTWRSCWNIGHEGLIPFLKLLLLVFMEPKLSWWSTQGAYSFLSKCVCVWTISKDVKLVTHHGQDPYPFFLPFLWSGIIALQNWAGPLPSLWTIPLVWFCFKIKNGQDPYPFREPFLWSGLLKKSRGARGPSRSSSQRSSMWWAR